MRRTILIGAMLSAVLVTGASAQTAQTPRAGSNETAAGTEVKMTGCLRSGEGSRDTQSGGTTAAAGAAPSQYVLTEAATVPEAKATRGQDASTGAAGSSPAATSYRLTGNQGDLLKYVNSKVEVLATLSTSSNSGPAPSTGATSGATGTAGATGAGATATRETGTTSTMPTLRVSSVRRLATSCMP